MVNYRCDNCLKVNIKELMPSEVESPYPSGWKTYYSVRDIFNEEESQKRPAFEIASNLDNLCHSAYLGCYLCRFMLQSIWIQWRVWEAEAMPVRDRARIWNSFLPDRIKNIGPIRLTSRVPHPDDASVPILENYLHIDGEQIKYPRLVVEPLGITLSAQDANSPYIEREVSPAVNPLDDSVIRLIHDWTLNCSTNHIFCKHLSPENWKDEFTYLRMIEVCAFEDRSKLRLVPYLSIREGLGTAKFDYVALSYQWGQVDSEKFMTTSLNIDQRQKSFSYDSIPRTMQHAVDVTRRLGHRYLWIDALCIIQSHQRDQGVFMTSDLELHLQIMHLVYARALYTIATCYSRHSDAGFLEDRWFAVYDATEVEIPLNREPNFGPSNQGSSSGRDQISVPTLQEPRALYKALWRPDWDTAIESAPLESRGWCFQERALSARRLCFTPYGLYWECHEFTASESRPEGYATGPQQRDKQKSLQSKRNYMLKIGGLLDTSDYSQTTWQHLVALYSARKLGRPNQPVFDRLNALVGIANDWRTKSGRKDRYLAGIWEADLATDLNWRPENSMWMSESRPISKTSGFPSWSWASIGNCEVCYPWGTHQSIERVAKAWDPPVCLLDADETPTPTYLIIEGWLAKVPTSLADTGTDKYLRERIDDIQLSPQDYKLRWGSDTAGFKFGNEYMYCLVLSSYDLYSGGDLNTTIILEPTEHTDVFRRVGWFDTTLKGCLRLGEKRRIKLI